MRSLSHAVQYELLSIAGARVIPYSLLVMIKRKFLTILAILGIVSGLFIYFTIQKGPSADEITLVGVQCPLDPSTATSLTNNQFTLYGSCVSGGKSWFCSASGTGLWWQNQKSSFQTDCHEKLCPAEPSFSQGRPQYLWEQQVNDPCEELRTKRTPLPTPPPATSQRSSSNATSTNQPQATQNSPQVITPAPLPTRKPIVSPQAPKMSKKESLLGKLWSSVSSFFLGLFH